MLLLFFVLFECFTLERRRGVSGTRDRRAVLCVFFPTGRGLYARCNLPTVRTGLGGAT